jgi:glucose-1-phosphate cytidylyltransferase
MKVVLFCGGMGMRLRDHSGSIPKPMVEIGYRPILWHIMKYYAHYGHKDFILCLGYKADVIKNYFLNYNECLSNDFVLSKGLKEVTLTNSDIGDWTITFADTGFHTNIGQRLKAVEQYLEGEEVFLANYADGLTDLHLPRLIEEFQARGKTAGFVVVKPRHSFHVVSMNNNAEVSAIQHLTESGIWINGGYFIFRKEIFQYIRDGEELIYEPFQRLIEKGELFSYKYEGFWAGMDTFKDKMEFEAVYQSGNPPWQVWNKKNKILRANKTAAQS